MAIDWTRGWDATWRLFRVDPATFSDTKLSRDVDTASIDRTADALLESGSLTVTRDPGEGFEPGYYRIVVVAAQGTRRERVELATLWCVSNSGKLDRGIDVLSVDGRSVLWPASRRKMLAGTYAPRGVDGAEYAGSLLGECIHAPVSVEGSFALADHVVFDLGCTYLDAVWLLLEAGGYCMQLDGHGTVHIRPLPTKTTTTISGDNVRLLMPGVSHTEDTAEMPNQYTAVLDGLTVTVTNDDAGSPVSTIARGYVDDEVDTSPKLLEDETLAAYANRMLEQRSVSGVSYGYSREWVPDVHPNSLIHLRLPRDAIDETMRVTRQRLACGRGIKVTEEASTEVRLWER